ncbi:hypothetical protein MTO96_011191 [Rhipicephalus appendiculatus]
MMKTPPPRRAAPRPNRNFSGRSGGFIEIHKERQPPTEQPLDFSLKSRAPSSRCCSPAPSEGDMRTSPPNHGSFGVIASNLSKTLPWNAPEVHRPNPVVGIPNTSTAATAATAISTPSPEVPFKINSYQNGFGPFCSSIMPFMSSLPSPPSGRLCDTAATPPLVRPPPSQQSAFPSMSLMPPATARRSPPSSGPPMVSKYVRPFKAYQRGDPFALGMCGVPGAYMPSAAPALTPGFHMADTSRDADFEAFRLSCLRDGSRNGRQDAHRRSKTTPAPASAARHTDAASSHPSLSNGNGTRRPDSGDDGDRTSPDNSNSSTATVANGVESATKESNGEATRNGGALCDGVTNGVSNGGSSSPPNGDAAGDCGRARNGRRRSRLPDTEKDSAYWERRRKNNEAAKRSRDARRAKEDEIAIRAAYLETQNTRLTYELAKAHAELAMLQQAVCASMVSNQQHQ